MNTHQFTLILSGVDDLDESMENSLYESGCDDALLGAQDGVVYLDFDRQDKSLLDALVSAIRDVQAAGYGVERVEPDNLVSAAEIARKTNRSRASILQLRRGQRGPGGFPKPVAAVRRNAPVWRWSEVANWMADHRLYDDAGEIEYARTIAWLNAAIDMTRIKIDARKASLDRALRLISRDSEGGVLKIERRGK